MKIMDSHGDDEEYAMIGDESYVRKPCCCGKLTRRQCNIFALSCTLFSVVMTLIIIFAIILPQERSQTQDIMDSSVMSFSAITIRNPTSNTTVLSTTGSVTGSGDKKATLHDSTISLVFDGVKVGDLFMPGMDLNSDPTNFDLNATLTITNMTAFNEFNHEVVFKDSVSWKLQGDIKVTPKLGSTSLFPITVNFDKTITVDGCGGLKNVSITSFSMKDSTADEVIATVVVDMHNPSAFSIDPVGDLTMDLYYEDSLVGPATSYNTVLARGDNVLTMTGAVNPSDHDKFQQMINRYVLGESNDVQARAGPNASSIPLFNGGLDGLVLDTVLDGLDVPLIQQLSFNAMWMEPISPDKVFLVAPSRVSLENLLGDDALFDVTSVTMELDMWSNGFTLNPNSRDYIGPVSVPYLEVSRSDADGFNCVLENTVPLVNNGSGMTAFLVPFVAFPYESFIRVNGTSSATATLSIGTYTLSDIPMDLTVGLKEMAALADNSVTYFSMDEAEDDDTAGVALVADIGNPSIGSLNLGTTVVSWSYNPLFTAALMGEMTDDSFLLPIGVSVHSLSGEFNPATTTTDSLSLIGEFLNNYLTGTASRIQLNVLSSAADDYPWLSLPLASLNLFTSIPGIDVQEKPLFGNLAVPSYSFNENDDTMDIDISFDMYVPFRWLNLIGLDGDIEVYDAQANMIGTAYSVVNTTTTTVNSTRSDKDTSNGRYTYNLDFTMQNMNYTGTSDVAAKFFVFTGDWIQSMSWGELPLNFVLGPITLQ